MIRRKLIAAVAAVVLASLVAGTGTVAKKKKKGDTQDPDRYAEFVWPPPPDEPRIGLEDVITGRSDVEAGSKLGKALIGASVQSIYDLMAKPFAVEFDAEGRLLVTDAGNAALLRFDRAGRRMDVFGTQGNVKLKVPLGLCRSATGGALVADAGLGAVVEFDAEGKIVRVYGGKGDLDNPTDVAVAPDGKSLYVTDSKAHRIVVFDRQTGNKSFEFGQRGDRDGEFAFPTSLTFDVEGNLFVVDQLNSRVQVVDAEGEYLDQFGALGVGYANFVRPKDIAVDDVGFIYVTDNAFNNLQLFDADFTLLTFVGEGGKGPGQFLGASGVAVHGDRFAVVDQLGKRVQVFRFLVPKDH